MFPIDFPTYRFNLKTISNKKLIFDIVRKKYVAATPEEFVRQHIIHYLVNEKFYPKALIAVEMTLILYQLKKRSDIVVYKHNEPCLIVECKAPKVKLDQAALEQIARYNLKLKVPYLLISNGIENYCCQIDFRNDSFRSLDFVPDYAALKTI